MARSMGHDRTRRPQLNIEDEEEDDPVEKMLKKTGCLELHYAVQECMADHKDWRKCQEQVAKFRACIQAQQSAIKPESKD
ncbi:cytochrome c oxidase assembly factor 4 homolog, mitochondrial-like [Limulus polyphemus]|uniref:Cytochrome c oxidase assembly factor 4 homolog, mitochondrial-like n=1 Tax=Limulus polyphemus TaxID=6850 RepID=A0ABM1B8T0_LIMPO|nr:cytochrome c oxidase assembly factor 4 homolog, mitochondrial-like [Limulus polyphemus]